MPETEDSFMKLFCHVSEYVTTIVVITRSVRGRRTDDLRACARITVPGRR
jgi:hypothetical protein